MTALLPEDDAPSLVLGEPASAAAISAAESHLALSFPPSYRELLSVANGVRSFADPIDLFSTEDLCTPWYAALREELARIGRRFGDEVLTGGFVFGGRYGERAVFLLDWTTEPDAHGERPVLYHADVELLRAASVGDFLDRWGEVAEQSLRDVREAH